jgi:hypothetical protein
MPLTPSDARHAAQIAAGTTGRKQGHSFEKALAADFKALDLTDDNLSLPPKVPLVVGNPAKELLRYIIHSLSLGGLKATDAWWLGGLATSGEGDLLLGPEGKKIGKSKSDVLVRIDHSRGACFVGVSVKTCNTPKPTNDQLFFTTASAFCGLLRIHKIPVSDKAEVALRMFCGDKGFRPVDDQRGVKGRISDPARWFWEELPNGGRKEWQEILTTNQSEITAILLQRAYLGDLWPPEFVLHQTCSYKNIHACEMAVFSVKDLVKASCQYASFHTRPYYIRKGTFKGDPNQHQAPRFGFIQFQRGGQKQHPTQLQFNLEAGYFYKLKKVS